jgi:hypothetical protein
VLSYRWRANYRPPRGAATMRHRAHQRWPIAAPEQAPTAVFAPRSCGAVDRRPWRPGSPQAFLFNMANPLASSDQDDRIMRWATSL